MKIDNVIIKSGVICAVTEELPDKPHCLDDAIDWKKYEKALQRIKDNAVPFEDQIEAGVKLLVHNGISYGETKENALRTVGRYLKDDTFYLLSVEVEIVYDPSKVIDGEESDSKKIARIKEPVVEKTAKSDLPKPSEMAIPDMEKLRLVIADMPEENRIEFINEHTQAAGKILFIAFHTAKLNHGINTTLVFKEEKYTLKFEKVNSPLTEENTKVRYQSEPVSYTQDELFCDLFQKLYDTLERGHGSMEDIKREFTITRKVN